MGIWTILKPLKIMTGRGLTVLFWCLLVAASCTSASQASTPINRSSGGEINKTNDNEPTFWTAEQLVPFYSPNRPMIRILFLYTQSVRDQYSIDDIDQSLEELIEQTNYAYRQTGIEATVGSAHVDAWPFGNEKEMATMTAFAIYTELKQWVNRSLWAEDGLMHRYAADAIFLVDTRDNHDNYCGWASIDSKTGLQDQNTSHSFGILRLGVGCGANATILAHELGHLLGSAHGNDDELLPYSALGHGTVCDKNSTIMHPGFPKHLLFSNPLILRNGEVCGDSENANNAKLFNENARLLANKQLYRLPSSKITLFLEDKPDSYGQSTNVTFYRSGRFENEAQIQWHYKNDNIENVKMLNGGSVFFGPGDVQKTVEIPAPKFVNPDDPQYTIYLRNPHGVTIDTNELVITDDIQSSVLIHFLVETDGLTLSLVDTSNYPEETEIVSIEWTIRGTKDDYQFEGTESSISTTVAEAGNYKIGLTVVDSNGTSYSTSVNIEITETDATTRRTLTAEENKRRASEGGSLSLLAICAITLIGWSRKSKLNNQIKQPSHRLTFI